MKILLLIHIGGAIVGLGPTAAFGIMGKMSGEVGLGGVHILEAGSRHAGRALHAAAVRRAAHLRERVRQRVLRSGMALHRNHPLRRDPVRLVSYVLDRPVIAKVVEMTKSGQAGTPEFQALVKKTSGYGAFIGIAFFIIIFLMVWKPGA